MIVCAYLLAREPMTFYIRRSTSSLSVQYVIHLVRDRGTTPIKDFFIIGEEKCNLLLKKHVRL